MEMRKDHPLEAPNFRLRRYPDYDVYRRAGFFPRPERPG